MLRLNRFFLSQFILRFRKAVVYSSTVDQNANSFVYFLLRFIIELRLDYKLTHKSYSAVISANFDFNIISVKSLENY